MRMKYYLCYDKDHQILGGAVCKATEIRNKFPDAKYIKVIQKPQNFHIFKDIDEEIHDMQKGC